ncbi:hypothetical protein JQ628_08255 [Bradyrhizobium lablabi]|uniref:hypothetical protein n=1 Tax=Bradyrhizobium lablabi TaxID=722472 RepID=UPI001BADEF64|nr:hypothetical protein [Bradyrhizobium lablabi]MBR1121499.1 hypothetical protein [Bradyrhizobium lablabi]
MKYKMYGALLASLSVAAVMLPAGDTFARPGGGAPAAAPPAGFARPAPMFRPGARAFRNHNRGTLGFFPGFGGFYGDYYDGAPYSQPPVDAVPQMPNKFHYTYSYDVPWDWTHRYPLTLPSDRPYVPGCNTEVVTVPGRGGDHSVNVTRCY